MKPGILSTEFWLTVIVGVLVNLGTIDVPHAFAWIVNLGLVVGYALSRGMAKYGAVSYPVFPVEPDPVDPVAYEMGDQAAATAPAETPK